ncbi:MAG: vWA domain-containing protein [Hyphomicrobiaceae bacterium]
MSNTRLYVHVLLDRSGSMESCRDATIEAYNSYVQSLKVHEATMTRLSLTLFDGQGIDTVIDNRPVGVVPALDRESFVPRGSTPLYDAIGRAVETIDVTKLAEGEAVALVIVTDGYENASREHNSASIKALLKDRQLAKGWLVLYLGANQDAWAEAARIGVGGAHALEFNMEHVQFALAGAARSTVAYSRTGDRLLGGFDDEAREKSAPAMLRRKPG